MHKYVLVVDDSPTSRDMLAHVLRRNGFTVAMAEGAGQALDLLRTEPFDFVVTDLDMPDRDGFDLIRSMAAMGADPGVVIVTARGDRNLRAARELALAYSTNLLGAFEKPVSEQDLLAAIQKVARPRSVTSHSQTKTLLSETEFMRGLMTDGLVAVFQPKVRTSDGEIDSFECFARWSAPGGSLLGASSVVRLAEEKGYLDVLAYRMLELALEQQGHWLRDGKRFKVSVNISGENLHKADFADVVSGLADQNEVPAELLQLEVNESDLGVVDAAHLEVLSRLHMRGFGLALDDFGTGYASLLQLDRIPFTELVIDRSFIHRATEHHMAKAVLEAAIGLSEKIGMSCTCEGVETEEQLALVKDLGADLVQGYLVANPMTAEDLMAWVEARA